MFTLLPFTGPGDRVWSCRLDGAPCAASSCSAFARRWRVAGQESERPRRERRRRRGGAGRDFAFYSEGRIRKPPMAPMGGRGAERRLLSPAAVRALAYRGADEREALPAGSPGLRSGRTCIRALSISGQFLWSRLLDATREAGKRQWAHSPGLAPRVGTLGIISKEHFPIPSLVSDIPAWVGCPRISVRAWAPRDRVSAALAPEEMVLFCRLLWFLTSSSPSYFN